MLCVTFLISFFAYARFCTLVIKDITEYLRIACFTMKKRKKGGGMCLGVGRGCNDAMVVGDVCMYAYLVVGSKSRIYSILYQF